MILGLVSVPSFATTKNACNAVIGFGSNFQPHLFINDNGALDGTSYNIFKETLKNLDCSLSYVNDIPAQRLVNNNEMLPSNVILAVTETTSRQERYHFSKPYMKEKVVVAFNKKAFGQLKSFEQLLSASELGVIHFSGYYGQDFEKLRTKYADKFIHAETSISGLQLLNRNRVDFFIGDELNLRYLIETQDFNDIYLSDYAVIEQDLKFAFLKSKYSKAFVERFDKALTSIMNKKNP